MHHGRLGHEQIQPQQQTPHSCNEFAGVCVCVHEANQQLQLWVRLLSGWVEATGGAQASSSPISVCLLKQVDAASRY